MDWLSKLEEERRRETAAEREKNENRRRAAEEFRSAIATMEARLRPVLSPLIDDIERRIGLRLGTNITGTYFTLFAPPAPNSHLIHKHRIVFSKPQGATRVRVAAIRAGLTDRSTEYKPDDMTLAEWQGRDDEVLVGEVAVKDLLDGDLQLLTEWLARTALSERGDRKRVPVPRIKISGGQPKALSRPRQPDKTARLYFRYLLPVLTMGGVVIFTGHMKELSALEWVWILLPGVNWLFLLGCLGIVPNELTPTYQVTAAALVALGGGWAVFRRMRQGPV